MNQMIEEAGTYMVIVEQQHGKEAKRQGDEYPADVEVPEINDPIPRLGGLEGLRRWNEGLMRALQMSRNM